MEAPGDGEAPIQADSAYRSNPAMPGLAAPGGLLLGEDREPLGRTFSRGRRNPVISGSDRLKTDDPTPDGPRPEIPADRPFRQGTIACHALNHAPARPYHPLILVSPSLISVGRARSRKMATPGRRSPRRQVAKQVRAHQALEGRAISLADPTLQRALDTQARTTRTIH